MAGPGATPAQRQSRPGSATHKCDAGNASSSFLRLHRSGHRSGWNPQSVYKAGEEIECGRRRQQLNNLSVVVRPLQLRVKSVVELIRRAVNAVRGAEPELFVLGVGPALEIVQAFHLRITGTFLF